MLQDEISSLKLKVTNPEDILISSDSMGNNTFNEVEMLSKACDKEVFQQDSIKNFEEALISKISPNIDKKLRNSTFKLAEENLSIIHPENASEKCHLNVDLTDCNGGIGITEVCNEKSISEVFEKSNNTFESEVITTLQSSIKIAKEESGISTADLKESPRCEEYHIETKHNRQNFLHCSKKKECNISVKTDLIPQCATNEKSSNLLRKKLIESFPLEDVHFYSGSDVEHSRSNFDLLTQKLERREVKFEQFISPGDSNKRKEAILPFIENNNINCMAQKSEEEQPSTVVLLYPCSRTAVIYRSLGHFASELFPNPYSSQECSITKFGQGEFKAFKHLSLIGVDSLPQCNTAVLEIDTEDQLSTQKKLHLGECCTKMIAASVDCPRDNLICLDEKLRHGNENPNLEINKKKDMEIREVILKNVAFDESDVKKNRLSSYSNDKMENVTAEALGDETIGAKYEIHSLAEDSGNKSDSSSLTCIELINSSSKEDCLLLKKGTCKGTRAVANSDIYTVIELFSVADIPVSESAMCLTSEVPHVPLPICNEGKESTSQEYVNSLALKETPVESTEELLIIDLFNPNEIESLRFKGSSVEGSCKMPTKNNHLSDLVLNEDGVFDKDMRQIASNGVVSSSESSVELISKDVIVLNSFPGLIECHSSRQNKHSGLNKNYEMVSEKYSCPIIISKGEVSNLNENGLIIEYIGLDQLKDKGEISSDFNCNARNLNETGAIIFDENKRLRTRQNRDKSEISYIQTNDSRMLLPDCYSRNTHENPGGDLEWSKDNINCQIARFNDNLGSDIKVIENMGKMSPAKDCYSEVKAVVTSLPGLKVLPSGKQSCIQDSDKTSGGDEEHSDICDHVSSSDSEDVPLARLRDSMKKKNEKPSDSVEEYSRQTTSSFRDSETSTDPDAQDKVSSGSENSFGNGSTKVSIPVKNHPGKVLQRKYIKRYRHSVDCSSKNSSSSSDSECNRKNKKGKHESQSSSESSNISYCHRKPSREALKEKRKSSEFHPKSDQENLSSDSEDLPLAKLRDNFMNKNCHTSENEGSSSSHEKSLKSSDSDAESRKSFHGQSRSSSSTCESSDDTNCEHLDKENSNEKVSKRCSSGSVSDTDRSEQSSEDVPLTSQTSSAFENGKSTDVSINNETPKASNLDAISRKSINSTIKSHESFNSESPFNGTSNVRTEIITSAEPIPCAGVGFDLSAKSIHRQNKVEKFCQTSFDFEGRSRKEDIEDCQSSSGSESPNSSVSSVEYIGTFKSNQFKRKELSVEKLNQNWGEINHGVGHKIQNDLQRYLIFRHHLPDIFNLNQSFSPSESERNKQMLKISLDAKNSEKPNCYLRQMLSTQVEEMKELVESVPEAEVSLDSSIRMNLCANKKSVNDRIMIKNLHKEYDVSSGLNSAKLREQSLCNDREMRTEKSEENSRKIEMVERKSIDREFGDEEENVISASQTDDRINSCESKKDGKCYEGIVNKTHTLRIVREKVEELATMLNETSSSDEDTTDRKLLYQPSSSNVITFGSKRKRNYTETKVSDKKCKLDHIKGKINELLMELNSASSSSNKDGPSVMGDNFENFESWLSCDQSCLEKNKNRERISHTEQKLKLIKGKVSEKFLSLINSSTLNHGQSVWKSYSNLDNEIQKDIGSKSEVKSSIIVNDTNQENGLHLANDVILRDTIASDETSLSEYEIINLGKDFLPEASADVDKYVLENNTNLNYNVFTEKTGDLVHLHTDRDKINSDFSVACVRKLNFKDGLKRYENSRENKKCTLGNDVNSVSYLNEENVFSNVVCLREKKSELEENSISYKTGKCDQILCRGSCSEDSQMHPPLSPLSADELIDSLIICTDGQNGEEQATSEVTSANLNIKHVDYFSEYQILGETRKDVDGTEKKQENNEEVCSIKKTYSVEEAESNVRAEEQNFQDFFNKILQAELEKPEKQQKCKTSRSDFINKELEVLKGRHFTSKDLSHLIRVFKDDAKAFRSKHIAKQLVKIISKEKEEEEEDKQVNIRFARCLTKTQYRILVVVIVLSKRCRRFRDLIEVVLDGISYQLFRPGQMPEVPARLSLAKMFIMLCKGTRDIGRARVFCYDALFCLGWDGITLVHVALQNWFPIISRKCREEVPGPVEATMFYCIYQRNGLNNEFDKSYLVQRILTRAYRSVIYQIKPEEILNWLMSKLKDGIDLEGLDVALILLARNQGWQWTHRYILCQGLASVFDEWTKEQFKLDTTVLAIKLIGLAVRSSTDKKDSAHKMITQVLYDSLNRTDLYPMEIQEALVQSIVYMSEFTPHRSIHALDDWVPSGTPSKGTVNMIIRLIHRMPRIYWSKSFRVWRRLPKMPENFAAIHRAGSYSTPGSALELLENPTKRVQCDPEIKGKWKSRQKPNEKTLWVIHLFSDWLKKEKQLWDNIVWVKSPNPKKRKKNPKTTLFDDQEPSLFL